VCPRARVSVSERPLDDLVVRLERERLEADRLYNDALTAVDHAIQQPPRLPPPPQRYDDDGLKPLNAAWDIMPDGPPPADRSIKGRLRAFVWRLLGPPLEAQRRFNREIIDHINRNVAAHYETQQAVEGLLDVARRELNALVHFESLLVQYLQTITIYVDTKDRSAGGHELRERVALAEQRVLALKREMETLLARPGRPAPEADGAPRETSTARVDPAGAFSANVDSLTYVGFEDRFRGSQDEIRSRLSDYLPVLASASDVVDVGCGRGELLDLMRQHGVTARGVDTNEGMVHLCRARGLNVEQSDALGFLERQRDGSLGGLAAIQVVEHFEPAYLLRFLETAYHKMRDGAPMVLETINPACWMAFFETYLRDITHRQALHPDTLRYLVQASGFTSVDVHFRESVRESDRLDHVSAGEAGSTTDAPAALVSVIRTVNDHADKLNARLFSSMDYAVIARR
jgi:2-polyprenyl-3-methyl-5-hydroxy-6-metoxy-1,4-benzoquinol methylase